MHTKPQGGPTLYRGRTPANKPTLVTGNKPANQPDKRKVGGCRKCRGGR